jgi:hypothetical protein
VEKPAVPRASIADVWRVPKAVWSARRALDAGELVRARAIAAPLLERFGQLTFVKKLAAEVLYASGDPLSAASLYEQVARKLTRDRTVTIGLVASYAALNRAGDARRGATMLPDDVDVRLALAWSELVAIGGVPERGARLVHELTLDPELARSRERAAMHLALSAIVAARSGDRDATRARLRDAERDASNVRHADRAFLGYLGGVALSEAGLAEDAIATFASAIDASPASIGAALARRERAKGGGASGPR